MATRGSNGSMPYFYILFILLTLFSLSTSGTHKALKREPCKRIVVYFHDILYNGNNAKNATSAIVGSPAGANMTALAPAMNHFGDLVVFDNPLTLDNNLHSTPVGRAQGMYFYDSHREGVWSAWFTFSFVFNSTDHKGTLTFAGADPLIGKKTRDVSVVGGTGDFFMARGIATFKNDEVEGDAYFRLLMDVKLYECWK